MRHFRVRIACAAILPVMLQISMAHAGSVIDNIRFANEITWPLGEPDTTNMGQTFKTPNATDTTLKNFTFVLQRRLGVTNYRPYVYEWVEELGGHITGEAIFAGGIGTVPEGQGFQRITIRTDGISLSSEKSYVAFFSTAGLFDGKPDETTWKVVSDGFDYGDGYFVFHNSRGELPSPSTRWECGVDCTYTDLAFRMTFIAAPVPEPGNLTLMLSGVVALVGTLRARRQSQQRIPLLPTRHEQNDC